MFETYGVAFLAAGAILVGLGCVWLLRAAWGTDWKWLVGILLAPPVALLFLVFCPQRAWRPITTILLGLVLGAGTIGLNLWLSEFDLGPREKLVEGQLHITLTGWDRGQEDYAILQAKPETVVLQMANPDVTDQTLKFLARMQDLEELDLNDTQVTDAGLATLAEFPKLRVLRLRGTAITDEGFRQHLLTKESLKQLDVRKTALASKTMRDWKNADGKNRRYLK